MAIKYRHQTGQAQRNKPRFEDPGHYTDKDRKKIPASDFGDPEGRKFPIVTQADVHDAARLIGKAANTDAVKRRIIAIAQRKGFALPDAWQEDERTTAPTVTRADAPDLTTLPFARITRIDEQNRLVTLRATSEATDTFRTAFQYEASKDAFRRWEETAGNIREMHQGKAVGRAVQVDYDDNSRAIDVTLRISKGAQDTWEKVVDGTLQGGSIGASNVVWQVNQQRASGAPEKVATKYDLVELSLVDNPSNPDCKVLAVRSAMPDMTILDSFEETPPVTLTPQADAARVAAQPPTPTPPSPADFYRYRQARADRIAAAGQRAEVEERRAHPQQQFEQTDAFIARVRAAAGAAEAAEMSKIAEEERAAQAQVQAVATPPLAPVTAETTRDAAPAPATGVTTSTGLQPYEMDNAAAIDTHVHDHKHRHTDGTVHGHPHLHDHGEAHRAAQSDETPHADHYHIYRAGKPLDARLANAEETRLPASQQGSGATMPGPKASSGSTVWDTAQPSNPVKKVTAKTVGHRVDYNTEDVEATDFGVPDPEEDRPTPGDEGETLTHPADMFHEGGEWPEATKLTGGHYDFDGDDDEGEGGDAPVIASRPPAPTTLDTSKMRPTPGNRAAKAEEERVGARISADSQDALHDVRDDGLNQVLKLCQHCGCDDCQNKARAIMVLLQPQDTDDDEDEGDEGMRMQLAAVARGQQQLARTVQSLASANEQLVAYLEAQGDLPAQLADITATIADTQRLAGAETTRATTQQQMQLAETTRALADTTQLVKALASSVEEVKAGVARIEATPMPTTAASAPLAEIKRLAMDRNTETTSTDQRIAALTEFSHAYTAQHGNDPSVQRVQQTAFEEAFKAMYGKR